MDVEADADDAAIFDARLISAPLARPRRRCARCMAATFVASALFSLPFYLIGAWPIVGFLGLDVARSTRLSRQFPRRPRL